MLKKLVYLRSQVGVWDEACGEIFPEPDKPKLKDIRIARKGVFFPQLNQKEMSM